LRRLLAALVQLNHVAIRIAHEVHEFGEKLAGEVRRFFPAYVRLSASIAC